MCGGRATLIIVAVACWAFAAVFIALAATLTTATHGTTLALAVIGGLSGGVALAASIGLCTMWC